MFELRPSNVLGREAEQVKVDQLPATSQSSGLKQGKLFRRLAAIASCGY